MPHFGKVHGLWLQATGELAAQAVDGVKGHVDPLEESGLQRLVFVTQLGKCRRILARRVRVQLARWQRCVIV